MKSKVAILLVFCMLFALIPTASAHWADEHVNYLVNEGVFEQNDKLFKDLDKKLTRAEMAKIVVCLMDGSIANEYMDVFTDVSFREVDDYIYIACAKDMGYVNGYADGTFRPKNLITREDFFTTIGRALEMSSDITSKEKDTKFKDESKIAAYSKPYICSLTEANIINGYGDGTINPNGNITVGEALAITHRSLLYLSKYLGEALPDNIVGQIHIAPSDDPNTLSIVLPSHASWPYNKDWPIWKWIEQDSGVHLDLTVIPDGDMETKIALLLASPDSLPDLIYMSSSYLIKQNALSGPFISISDNLDKMPNYEKFMDSLPKTERQELENQRRAPDGKIYQLPTYGTQEIRNVRSWLYRKDILEKQNLKVPTTQDELFATCQKLKSIYPDSYPFCIRNGIDQINVMAPMWKNDFNLFTYYNFKQNKWCYGAQDTEIMKEIISYFHKMLENKLVPPDLLTINSKSWEELISTDRGFIMTDYLVRIDFFNNANRKINPDFTLATMAPPKGNGKYGRQKIAKLNIDPTGYVICNTGEKERIDKSIQFVDWMYSDSATDLLSWGKKDESFKINSENKKEFMIDEDEFVENRYGIGTYGTFQRISSFTGGYSKEQSKQGKLALTYLEDHVNPTLWLGFNEEEQMRYNELNADIATYTEEMISKFIYNQEPMSKWDVFQKGLQEMGVEQLLGVYESAYNHTMH